MFGKESSGRYGTLRQGEFSFGSVRHGTAGTVRYGRPGIGRLRCVAVCLGKIWQARYGAV